MTKESGPIIRLTAGQTHDGDTNNKSWLSTAKWLEPGRLHKIDDVLL